MLSDDLLYDHFQGRHILAVYPLVGIEQDSNLKSFCNFLVADFDDHNGVRDPLPEVITFYETCQENEIPLYIIRSKSGNGYHSYLFFYSPVPAWKARLVGYALLQRAGIELNDSSFDNFFPAQDQTRNYGNCIAFPFQGEASLRAHTLFLNPETRFTEQYPNQWEILAEIQKIEESFLDNLVRQWQLERPQSTNARCRGREQGWVGRALHGVAEGDRNTTAAALAGYYINRGLRENEIADILSIWNTKNRPPMSQNELLRTIASIQAAHERQNQTDSFEFPIQIMSGFAGDFARLYSDHLESPIQFFYMSFLCCLGTALADKITLDIETFPQPRLFLVLLGQSADERKSTAISKTVDFFEQAFPDGQDRSWLGLGFDVCRGVGSAEGLQKRLRRRPKVLLFFDELKQFVSKCKIESSVLLPCVNTLFESNFYENETSKSRISIENAHLSVIGASTTNTWETLWSRAFIDIGFTNRIFLVPGVGQRQHAFPSRITDHEKFQIIYRLRPIAQTYRRLTRFEINIGARQLFERWYFDLPSSVHTKRLDTYGHRFMPLLAINDGKNIVDEETVEKTISLCDWQLKVRQLHDPIDADTNMANMEQRIRRALLTGEKNNSELKRMVNYSRAGIWFYENALKNLERAGEIRNIGTKKRPRWVLIS
jgi:hypothetical protein